MKTWIKLYTEINRDPDIGTLTWAQRGIWSALLALAGEIDDRDENEQETGRLDTSTRVAWSIRCDLAELDEAIQMAKELKSPTAIIQAVMGKAKMYGFEKQVHQHSGDEENPIHQKVTVVIKDK